MSIQDERDLAQRLGGLLDGLEPTPAPVAATMRRGKGIRFRRQVGVAVGVAVVVAAAAVLPGVLRAPAAHPTPISPLRYTVTVQPPARDAPRGTVAQGVTDGKHWRLVLSGSPKDLAVGVAGPIGRSMGLISATAMAPGSWPANFESEGSPAGAHNYEMLFGTVRHDVARVAIHLPDGEVANLTPVRWDKYRWAGLILPAGVPIARAIAYDSAGAEIAYAIPFGNLGLSAWWAPRQTGPARATTSIGAGTVGTVHWHVTAEIGPWGYCYAWGKGDSGCSTGTSNPEIVPSGKALSFFSCGPAGRSATGPDVGVAFAATVVRTVVLHYSDGTRASFPTVWVSGGRVFAYTIPEHTRVTSARALDAVGQLVGTIPGSASAWRC